MMERMTNQKKYLLSILCESALPLNAKNLYEKIQKKYPLIAKSTVYRILTHLVDNHQAERFFLSENETFYQLKRGEHQHYIICNSCHRIFPLTDCPFEKMDDHIESSTGFIIQDHYFQLYGFCPECQRKPLAGSL